MIDLGLEGRTVVVTGASRGIGRVTAAAFLAEGARVIGTRTAAGEEPPASGHEWMSVDFSDIAQLESCVEELARLSPDVLVNNAGINRIAPFAEVPASDFLDIQRVNLFAAFRLCQAVVPGMTQRGWGRIVNVSSIWGKISRAHRASYSASKFALDGMTIALALEYAKDGVLANCVAPGFIDTEMTRTILGEAGIASVVATIPAARLARPEEIAEAILWLSSARNTYVTGQNIAVDGGFTRA